MCPLGHKVVGCNLCNLAPRNVPRPSVGSGIVGRCRSRSKPLQTKIRVASGSQEPQTAEAGYQSQRDEHFELLRPSSANSHEWDEEATESQASAMISVEEAEEQARKQAQMYKQLAASRNRLSTRLSEANKYISFMETRMESSTTTVQAAHDATEKVLHELGTLSRMVETAAAAVKFGIDKEDAVEKLMTLQSRIELAQEAVATEQAALGRVVPRRVPVSWERMK